MTTPTSTALDWILSQDYFNICRDKGYCVQVMGRTFRGITFDDAILDAYEEMVLKVARFDLQESDER